MHIYFVCLSKKKQLKSSIVGEVGSVGEGIII